MTEYTREKLISLCCDGVVPHDKWRNRDTSAAQRQLGEAHALLAAGCDFTVLHGQHMRTDERTVWIVIRFDGFGHFDWDGGQDDETYYIPTRARLEANKGRDWY